MSHTSEIAVELKNEQSLIKALEQLGWGTKFNTKLRTYYKDPQKDTVYPLAGINPKEHGFDIGFRYAGERITTHCDFYGGSIEASLGAGLTRLKDAYAVEEIKRYYSLAGASVSCKRLENGNYDLEVTGDLLLV
jgi:hypothetical protein